MRLIKNLTLACFLAILPSAAMANTPEPEAEILRKIHAINQTEIKAGKLAEQKGQSTAAKDYGKHLVADHTHVDKELVSLAKSKGVLLTKSDSPTVQDRTQRESGLLGKLKACGKTDFDQTFAEEMDKAHQATIAELETDKKTLAGTDTARFIGELMPSLIRHQEMAAKIEKKK